MSDAPNGAPAPVAFGTERLVDDNEFLGICVVDEMVTGNYGPQWHYAIKPVDYELGGSTGAYGQYVPADKVTLNSKFGKAMVAFVMVFGQNAAPQVGAGHFVGRACIWKRVNTNYGTRKETKEAIVSEQILPLRLPNDAERARAEAKGVTLTVQTVPAMQLTPEQITAVQRIVDGLDAQGAVVAAARSKLPQDVKGGILNGTVIPGLIEMGHLSLNAEGKYAVPEEAVTA